MRLIPLITHNCDPTLEEAGSHTVEEGTTGITDVAGIFGCRRLSLQTFFQPRKLFVGCQQLAGTLCEVPVDENLFADSIFLDRTQDLQLSNTKSLYSTVMNGKGITNDSRFIELDRGVMCARSVGAGTRLTSQPVVRLCLARYAPCRSHRLSAAACWGCTGRWG